MKNDLENMTSPQLKQNVLDLQKQNQVIQETLGKITGHYSQIEERYKQVESSCQDYAKLSIFLEEKTTCLQDLMMEQNARPCFILSL